MPPPPVTIPDDADHAPPPIKTTREPPSGIEPLFFTSTSQELFHIVTGKDVTKDNPHTIIPKKDILDDIQFRGVISDFHPVKEKVKDYPGDDLLIVFDDEGLYDQNFYLCVTPEAREKEIWRLEEMRRMALEGPRDKPEKKERTKGWISLGSEKEIEEERVVNNRDLIVVLVTRKRRDFGGSHKFQDRDANDAFYEQRPFKDPNFELRRMEHDVGIQVQASVSESGTQTTWNRKVNKIIQYSSLDAERVDKNKILHSDPLTDFLHTVANRTEEALQQNETMNIYEDDFEVLAEEDTTIGNKNDNHIKEAYSFTDIAYKSKLIACIDWMPNARGVVAVSCVEAANFDGRVDISGKVRSSAVLIWNFIDTIHPQFVLESPSDVMCFRFNPRSPDLIAGGCYSGQVVLWDISAAQAALKSKELQKKDEDRGQSDGRAPVIKAQIVSSAETSHKQPVSDLHWLPPSFEINAKGKVLEKTEAAGGPVQQFVSTSADGAILVWDLRVARKELSTREREATWNPTYEAPLNRVDGTQGTMGSLAVSLSPDPAKDKELPKEAITQFVAATESGEVAFGDFASQVQQAEDEEQEGAPVAVGAARKVKKPDYVKSAILGHLGPVLVCQRSPFFHDIILTAGDWTFNIWKEGLREPIFTSPFSGSYITAARWSPTRPAVVAIAKEDGVLEVWDLLDRSHEASIRDSLFSYPITSIEFWTSYTSQGSVSRQLLALGDNQGTLHIYETPRPLRRPVANERAVMQGYFAREVRKVAYYEERREIRLRDKPYRPPSVDDSAAQAAAAAGGASPAPGQPSTAQQLAEEAAAAAEREEDAAEKDYKKYEEKLMKDLGIETPAERAAREAEEEKLRQLQAAAQAAGGG